MWPFKQPVPQDDTETLIIPGQGYINLAVDQELYDKCIDKIKSYLKVWAMQDIVLATSTNQPVESTLIYQLKDIDLKFLPYPSYKEVLILCMKDTPVNNSGSRFFDTVVRIHLAIDPSILAAIKGRFISSMTYALSAAINDTPLPSKSDWIQLLAELPWVIYLPFIQELYDTDEQIMHETKYIASSSLKTSSVVEAY